MALCRSIHPVNTNSFLSSVVPGSQVFGFDRGMPVDRYYIEKFLQTESAKLTDAISVLEVEENTYSQKYFPTGNHDVLHYSNGMDLTNLVTLPASSYRV